MKFAKYEGVGNDFILIDDRNQEFSYSPELVRNLCHRRLGIGADGLILLQNHPTADVQMRIFNADGFETSSCGNGLRCFMRFLSDLGYPERTTCIAIGDRVLSADYRSDGIAIDMGEMRDLQLNIALEGHQLHFVDSGVPHVVSFDPAPLETFGPYIRFHRHFAPHGANVNICDPITCKIRTYERGVEGETLGCGTGVTAVAVIGSQLYGWESPVSIHCPGGTLTIHFDSSLKSVIMVGPANRVFWGEI